jgi:hypothetical protein
MPGRDHHRDQLERFEGFWEPPGADERAAYDDDRDW